MFSQDQAQHMPELTSKFGYPFALAVMLLSVIVPMAYFKKKMAVMLIFKYFCSSEMLRSI